MRYQDFRDTIQSLKKYPGTKKVERCPLVNPGFPGAFNMSFGEDPILKEFGKYQYFDHDALFSTIQEVVRHNDVFAGVKMQPQKYLGVFEMADIYGLITLKEKTDLVELQRQQVSATINLILNLGIEAKNIYPRYCGGGGVEKLTASKYCFDFKIPEDIVTFKALTEAGVPENNIIKDYSRDTLLALNLASGNIAWGYRTEIEVKMGSDLLDVATIELFLWDPVLSNRQIVGLKDITYTLALAVTGVERLFMAANNLMDVRKIEHIQRLYDLVGKYDVEVEYLRTLHAIISDKEAFGFELGKHRRVYMNRMVRDIHLTHEKIGGILTVNAELQPWHPELKKGVEATLNYIRLQKVL